MRDLCGVRALIFCVCLPETKNQGNLPRRILDGGVGVRGFGLFHVEELLEF